MTHDDGYLHNVKAAFGAYMGRFYAGIFADTRSLREYTQRGLARSIAFAPGRMVDQVDDMIKAYLKNDNSTGEKVPPERPYTAGKNALFPMIVLAMAKDYNPTPADFGGRQLQRRLVCLEEGENPSVYGYRQAMGEIRAQVAIMAAETTTAQSLAAQFLLFVGEQKNRRFKVNYEWGQYQLEMPCILETPDVFFSKVDSENSNMTILSVDLNLRTVFPYLDAPKDDEENDGTGRNPPGYPMVEQFNLHNEVTLVDRIVAIES